MHSAILSGAMSEKQKQDGQMPDHQEAIDTDSRSNSALMHLMLCSLPGCYTTRLGANLEPSRLCKP